jgi:hypothetical protein
VAPIVEAEAPASVAANDPAGMFDEPAETSTVEQADQAGGDEPGTSLVVATAASENGEARPGEGETPGAVEQATDEDEDDGEQLFEDIFAGEGEAEQPEQVPEPIAEAPAPEPEPVVASAPPSSEPEQSSVGPVDVLLGRTRGVLHRVPRGVVQTILGASTMQRVETLRVSSSIVDLQKRMRASDGRCAPMIFTAEGGEGDVPVVFSGLDAFAAAINLALPLVSVVTIKPGDAGAMQSWLVQQRTKPAEQEDDLLHRVHAHDED